MKVLVAMSGGVDSSVAAALLLDAGHDVTGVTMKLWGGPSDTGCCSVADVDDARRVAQQLGIDHHVFNFGDAFEEHVVAPYVADHAAGRTPNPCVECNRHVKFDKLLRRAAALGFDAVATGHHARIVDTTGGPRRVARGADRAKDQSYVLAMLGPAELARLVFPVGERTKQDVRALAGARGLRTATKPDSQDVCFITATGGRRSFLCDRLRLHEARVVDREGREVGHVDAVELVTIGQRRGLGLTRGHGDPRYAVAVDVASRTVTVGSDADLLTPGLALEAMAWSGGPVDGAVLAQCSAHGAARPATFDVATGVLTWDEPQRRVAPGQTVALYDGDHVLGAGLAALQPPAGIVPVHRRASFGPASALSFPRVRATENVPASVENGACASGSHGEAAAAGFGEETAGPARGEEDPVRADEFGGPAPAAESHRRRLREVQGEREADGTSREVEAVGAALRWPDPPYPIAKEQHRFRQRQRVVDHDPGGDEHHPASRQPVEGAGGDERRGPAGQQRE